MRNEEENFSRARCRMVESQLQSRDIRNPRVLEAMQTLPRERFVSGDLQSQAYQDHPLPLGCGQTISQPYVVALMLQELDVQPGQHVLDVGSGSGYQTALLAKLVSGSRAERCGRVFAVERVAELALGAETILSGLGISNVSWRTGDGSLGWASAAPFDRIICGAAAPEVPQAWIDQLVEGGRIVLPLGGRDVQKLWRIEKHGDQILRKPLCAVRFVPLIGEGAWGG